MNNHKGQAAVEFTLIAMLFLIIAWIPVDFGLAFFTSQQVQNASREGARIAAADPAANTLAGGSPCALSTCYTLAVTHPKHRAAARVSSVLMPDTTVDLQMTGSGCNQMVVMTVTGTYNFFFYRMLGWMGISTPQGRNITRSTSMRWEHQC